MANISDEGLSIRSAINNMTTSDIKRAADVNKMDLELYNVYLYIVIALGLPGNILVLVVFSKHKPTTTTDWFILFITVCDFVILVINVPVYITLSNGVWYKYGNNTICRLHMFVSQSVVLSSSFLICGLALDRYFRICKPMTSYSTQRARNVCVFISISTTILSTPCVVMYENRQGSCQAKMGIGLFIYYLFLFLAFTVATITVIVSYIQVNRRIKQTGSDITMYDLSRRTKRALQNSMIAPTRKVNQVNPCCDQCRNDNVFGKHNDMTRNNGRGETSRPAARLSDPKGDRDKTVKVSTVTGKNVNVLLSRNPESSASTAVLQTRISTYKQASLLATKISFIVCGIFIISWTPPWATFIVSITGNDPSFPAELLMFTRKTNLLNTMTNPILYAWLNRKFQKHLLDIMRCRRI